MERNKKVVVFNGLTLQFFMRLGRDLCEQRHPDVFSDVEYTDAIGESSMFSGDKVQEVLEQRFPGVCDYGSLWAGVVSGAFYNFVQDNIALLQFEGLRVTLEWKDTKVPERTFLMFVRLAQAIATRELTQADFLEGGDS
jgi:hypothetical protein